MGTALLSLEHLPVTAYNQAAFTDSRPARRLLYQGGLLTVHIDSEDTERKFALVEFQGTPGGEPPMHVHRNEDELFYVMEGKLTIWRGDEEFVVAPGQSVFLPRGVPHTFKIMSEEARGLVYLTPGGFENYFREMGTPVGSRQVPKMADVAEIIRVASRYGITIMPPKLS